LKDICDSYLPGRRSDLVTLAPLLKALSLPKFLREMDVHVFSLPQQAAE
jgi:hypothetical protein